MFVGLEFVSPSPMWRERGSSNCTTSRDVYPMWSWQDLVFAGIGFGNSQTAGAAAFLVGSTPMRKGQSSSIFVIPLVSRSGDA